MIIGLNGRMHSGKDLVAKIIQYLLMYRNSKEPFLPFDEWLQWFYKNDRKAIESVIGWQTKKFAYKLKQIATILTGVPIEKWEDQDFKKKEMSMEWSTLKQVSENELDGKTLGDGYLWVPMTHREFLQKLGTECMRDGLHVDTWVNALMSEYVQNIPSGPTPNFEGTGQSYTYPNWIISDMRFPNEFEAVKEREGICVKIERFGTISRSRAGGETWEEPFDKANPQHVQLLKAESVRLHQSEIALNNYTFDYVLSNHGTIEDLIEEVRKMLVHFKLLTDATSNGNHERP